jgi:hypothetical protein
MRYLIFQDQETKTFHPVFFSGHLDPPKVKVEGMTLSSGGELNIAPESRFGVQPSEFYRSDEDDHQFVGAAIGGLDISEFKRKKPVLLFKLSNEATMRKAHSIAELVEIPGFPENVSWVSNAKGTPAFDRFFEVTEDGISVKKPKADEVEEASEEYFDLVMQRDPSGLVGVATLDGKISSSRRENIDEIGDSPEDSLIWRYSSLTGAVYWFSDPGGEIIKSVSDHLASKGYKVSKNSIVKQTQTAGDEVDEVDSPQEEERLKKPKKKVK